MSIFRKKPGTKNLPPEDPVSFAVWQEIRAAVFAVRCADKTSAQRTVTDHMEDSLRLTPAARTNSLTTRIPSTWSYLDFTACVKAIEAVTAALVVLDVINRDELVSRMNEALVPYTKLTKTERAMERISGEKSERSGR